MKNILFAVAVTTSDSHSCTSRFKVAEIQNVGLLVESGIRKGDIVSTTCCLAEELNVKSGPHKFKELLWVVNREPSIKTSGTMKCLGWPLSWTHPFYVPSRKVWMVLQKICVNPGPWPPSS